MKMDLIPKQKSRGPEPPTACDRAVFDTTRRPASMRGLSDKGHGLWSSHIRVSGIIALGGTDSVEARDEASAALEFGSSQEDTVKL